MKVYVLLTGSGTHTDHIRIQSVYDTEAKAEDAAFADAIDYAEGEGKDCTEAKKLKTLEEKQGFLDTLYHTFWYEVHEKEIC